MENEVQEILQSDLPNALQLTWIAMWKSSVDGLYADSIAEVGRMRDISRQAASKQVKRLVKNGVAKEIGNAYRLVTDDVSEGIDNRNPSVDEDNSRDDNVNESIPLSSLPFSPKKVHSTPFHPSHLSPGKVETVQPGWAPPPQWLRQSELVGDDHPVTWEYHPDDWRWQAGKYMLDNLRELELLNSHYLRRLRNGASEGQIASEWADTFRLLVEQDGWQREEIAVTLRWLFETENWWKKNRVIQTAKSLRKRDDEGTTKFDKIIQSAVRDYEQRQENHVSPKEIYDGWDDNASDASKSAVSNGQRVEREGVGWHT